MLHSRLRDNRDAEHGFTMTDILVTMHYNTDSLTVNYNQNPHGSNTTQPINCHQNNASLLGSVETPLSRDTALRVYGNPNSDNGFVIEAWNETGNLDGTFGKIFSFKSEQGGFQ